MSVPLSKPSDEHPPTWPNYIDNPPAIERDPALDEEWGAWLESQYDPDSHPWDTMDEQNGHA